MPYLLYSPVHVETFFDANSGIRHIVEGEKSSADESEMMFQNRVNQAFRIIMENQGFFERFNGLSYNQLNQDDILAIRQVFGYSNQVNKIMSGIVRYG